MLFLLPEPTGDVLCALVRGREERKIFNWPTGNLSFISVVGQIPSFLCPMFHVFSIVKIERDNL